MITLYQPPAAWGTPSLSPFCIKLELYLKLAKLEYVVAPANPMKAPKGKMPYVRIDDSPLLGDSQLILEALKQRFGDPLDANLTAAQRALGHLVRRTLEEATYFTGLYTRWLVDENFAVVATEFRKFVPFFAPPLIRRNVRKAAKAQGIARHTKEEVEAMAHADWTAIAQILGESRWLLGDAPTSHDATLFAFLESTLGFPRLTPIRAHIETLPNLVSYRERIKAEYFPEHLAAATS